MLSKKIILLLTIIGLIAGCGSNTSGVDPHLSVEEQQELTEVNLVGKWKLRPRNIGSVGNKWGNNCQLEGIEFFADRSYLLSLMSPTSGDTLRRIYRGKYDLLFEEENNQVNLRKIVLMDRNYTSGSTFPSSGSVATIDNITLDDQAIQFRIQYGEGLSDFCTLNSPYEVSGEKEDKVTEDNTQGTNNERIQNEWRLIGVEAQVEENQSAATQSICFFFEDEFYERCYDENAESFDNDCPQAVTTTLLISGYGTYLFTYFDAFDNVLSTDQGDWRWRTDTEERYTAFEVKDPSESFSDDAAIISILSLTDTTMTLEETSDEYDELGNSIRVQLRYNFQLASLNYQDTACGDFTAQ